MKDGMFVFDAVIHRQDTRPVNTRTEIADQIGAGVQANVTGWATEDNPGNPAILGRLNDISEAVELFTTSDTDMAMVQTVPLLEYWYDGLSPADKQAEFAAALPERVIFCGGVDPLQQGIRGARDEMERQVNELGAKSFKLYQAQSRDLKWAADDRAIAYPIYEKALELGINFVQFHKGLPLGDQNLEDLRSLDIQRAALDFPDMTFGLHHLGDPFFEETIAVAARRSNVVLVLPIWFNQYMVQPRRMIKLLGHALFDVGADRLMYGSEAFLWPRVQTFIDMFAELEMPEDLQEGYGYPALDREIKEKIFGLNLARVLGIDVEKAKATIEAAGEADGMSELDHVDQPRCDHRVEQVEAMFEEQIRPRLAAHLGGAVVDGIDDDGVVHVTFTGACTSCAYRKTTMLTAIYPRLREVDGVVGVATPGVPISRAEERRIGAMLDRYEKR